VYRPIYRGNGQTTAASALIILRLLMYVWEEAMGNYRVGYKNRVTLLLFIATPINDRSSKFFHWHTLQTICNNVIIT